LKYPRLKDAIAAGFRRAGPYAPGLGLHVIKFAGTGSANVDGTMDADALANPLSILYDGTGPNAKIAGFMYYSFSSKQPEGFAGDNDYWHYHTNVCSKYNADGSSDAPLGADRPVTQAQCAAVGGILLPTTQYMVHVWTVPGYTVSAADGGVFGEVNPALTCADGTYHMLPMDQWASHPVNVCADLGLAVPGT
jgi:hypothetical protein